NHKLESFLHSLSRTHPLFSSISPPSCLPVSSNFIPSNPSPPRRRHSSLPRLTVRSAVTSVGYREATVPGAFRLHQFILLGDSLLFSKSGRKTMIMSLRREGMPSPSLSNLMWLYIFYYYIDVDYMENRRYDERSDYAGGLKAGRRLSSGTSSSNKNDIGESS
ncbi:hypothetical protein HID58_055543, partial [Brassica napus]